MKVFYHPVQKKHRLNHEIIDGKLHRHHEKHARLQSILKQLKTDISFEFVTPPLLKKEYLLNVHDELYVDFLKRSEQLGKNEIIWPYVFPNDSRLGQVEPVTALTAGHYCFDVGTPIMHNTWPAAEAAASAAFAAAHSVHASGETSYALCRPPGHHAGEKIFGGYCYLNNAAIAARYLSQFGSVLIVDFDFHHGNGTQSIFYDDPKVFYLSTHADPLVEYPYFSGWAHEKGIDDGIGYNLNIPLPKMCGPAVYFDALKRGLQHALKQSNPKYLILSAGFDIADQDPLGHFGLLPEDFFNLGTLFKSLNKPTVVVQEGGYLVSRLGLNVLAFLSALR